MAMEIFDKLTGSKRPDSGVVPHSADEIRATLLALNGPGVPYRVRKAAPTEKSDMVAECQIARVGVRLKTTMRLIPDKREVRFLDERWENRSTDQAKTQYGRGHAPAVFRQWETTQGPDGRKHKAEAFRFDTREMTDPLRDVVLSAGWTWRGVFML